MHGHIRIGDVAIFVSDASGFAKPTSSNLFLYVPDVDPASTFIRSSRKTCSTTL
jgi:hypothetical protein